MKHWMTRTGVMALVLVLILGLVLVHAEAFTPPGHARKAALEADEEWDDDFLLPPGLRNKGVPPGLQKQGYTLPPGLMNRGLDELPPGIMMRFLHTWEWQEREAPWQRETDEDRVLIEVETLDELLDALNEELEEDQWLLIRLENDIELEETLVIDRDVTIDGQQNFLTAGDEFDGWMVEVEEGAELKLYRTGIQGDMDDEGNPGDVDGLISVDWDAVLTSGSNRLYDAPIGVALYVDEFEEGDEAELLPSGITFTNVTVPVVI